MKERGAASIRIELSKGNITVTHGDHPGLILAELRDAPAGTWDRLWDAFAAVGIKRRFKEEGETP